MYRSLRLSVLLVAMVAALGIAPSLAAAGSYTIETCGAGLNKSWSPSASDGMAAGPQPTACGDGLTVHNKVGSSGSTVPSRSAARFSMKAPAGTSIGRVTLTGRFDTRGGKWQAVLSNGSTVLAGCPRDSAPCSKQLDHQIVQMPASGTLYIEAFCPRGPCSTARGDDADVDHLLARVRIHAASVLINDNTLPALSNGGGSAWTGAWMGGKRFVTFDADDGSGITTVQSLLDGRLVGQRTRLCGDHAYTCGPWHGASLDVDVSRLNDGAHTLSLVATDRASNRGVASHTINVDNTPPSPPVNLSSNVRHGWTSKQTVRLAWANPAQQFAPIAGATVRACPAGQSAGCTTLDYAGAGLSQVDYALPGEGAWDLQVWLRDAAGNTAPSQASAVLRVGLDRQPPTGVAFLPLDSNNPSVLHVRASDALSGIAGGRVEIRRRHGKAWRKLPTSVEPGGLRAQLTDGRLRRGRYRLRARVFDVAGNERSTHRQVGGKKAGVRLPVRVAVRLRVGKVRARHHRRARIKYARHPIVRAGRRTRVGGRLTAPGGNPLRHARVEVSARLDLPGKKFRPIARLRTSKRGRFSYSLPPGRSRVVRFVYRGRRLLRPQKQTVRVRVRAATTMAANHRKVVNGETVTFSGRVRTGPQPDTGKLVELQYRDRGEWRTFRSVHAGPKGGRWSFGYRFTGTSGSRTYKFRAHLPRESGYGYASGASHPVKVRVRGL